MINVTIGTNTKRTNVLVAEDATIKQALNDNNIDYSTAAIHLDGATLSAAELNKSFADMGITDKCYLLAVVKADSAR